MLWGLEIIPLNGLSEKSLEQELRPKYVATDRNGLLIATYQIVD